MNPAGEAGARGGAARDGGTGAGDVLVERRAGILYLTLNRPHVLNALRTATVEELHEALEAAEADDTVGAIILAGAGRAFSAGIDLKELAALLEAGEPPDAARARLERLQALTRRIVDHRAPVIVAVHGPAVGLAAELCVAADLRLVARGAFVRFPEASRGLTPTNGVTLLLPRLVGRGRAADWLLTGRPVEAEEARRAGLAHRVVEPGALLASAREVAGLAAAAPRSAVRSAKRLLAAAESTALDAALERELEAALASMATREYGEGLRAFVEKRSPSFGGGEPRDPSVGEE